MTTDIVGFVADLESSGSQIWSAMPVVEEEGHLSVIATPNQESENHRLAASWDDPGVHRLPNGSGKPFSPDDGEQRVAIATVAFLRKLLGRARWSLLTSDISSRWTEIESGHYVCVITRERFDDLRTQAQAQLIPTFLGAARDETDAVRREAFELYRALAPRQTVEYLATLAAFYSSEGLLDRVARLERRAVRDGIDPEVLWRTQKIIEEQRETQAERTAEGPKQVTQAIRGIVEGVEAARPDVAPVTVLHELGLSVGEREKFSSLDRSVSVGDLAHLLHGYGWVLKVSARPESDLEDLDPTTQGRLEHYVISDHRRIGDEPAEGWKYSVHHTSALKTRSVFDATIALVASNDTVAATKTFFNHKPKALS
ncbi:hypothetical protein EDF48_103372 [Curtobacterium sp. PhB191]|uniref:hypothetical protein n=1 Tax=Curtobacterium sp. PhB191 TaxID=2485202 RepID=UPI001050CF20|nr:hypothetical protein [Curtobacterium sp. PhB191]TCU86067.1 hypothetical protein EDF48_103372 [Curtobacterium sp. PhB191]